MLSRQAVTHSVLSKTRAGKLVNRLRKQCTDTSVVACASKVMDVWEKQLIAIEKEIGIPSGVGKIQRARLMESSVPELHFPISWSVYDDADISERGKSLKMACEYASHLLPQRLRHIQMGNLPCGSLAPLRCTELLVLSGIHFNMPAQRLFFEIRSIAPGFSSKHAGAWRHRYPG